MLHSPTVKCDVPNVYYVRVTLSRELYPQAGEGVNVTCRCTTTPMGELAVCLKNVTTCTSQLNHSHSVGYTHCNRELCEFVKHHS